MKKSLRIVQLIDSLHPGGAERMALNLANGLATQIEFSGLMITRQEGGLHTLIEKDTPYIFLQRKGLFDFKALFKAIKWLKKHRVEVFHIHGTSLFFGVLCKIFIPNLRLIWHDHYGNSELLEKRPKIFLFLLTRFVDRVIVVNQNLYQWNLLKLRIAKVKMIPNFSELKKLTDQQYENTMQLPGEKGKRILCVANFRAQKNHVLILKVAEKIKICYPDWTFHLVGKSFQDDYIKNLKHLVSENHLNNVFFYHEALNVEYFLQQSTIGILSSNSEGLPLVVLEYASHALPVLSTNVGDVSLVIKDQINGFLVSPNDEEAFYQRLVQLIENKNLRNELGKKIKNHVASEFSSEGFYKNYFSFLEAI